MIKAIIYNSNSGFTKQYAYHFALKCNLPIYTIKEAKKNLTKGDEIIYFSWIFANKIVKLKKVLKYKISYVACVGMSFYSEELINTLKEYNNINNLYYLQGGIRLRELKPSQRTLREYPPPGKPEPRRWSWPPEPRRGTGPCSGRKPAPG